jgi:hypothetical protein
VEEVAVACDAVAEAVTFKKKALFPRNFTCFLGRQEQSFLKVREKFYRFTEQGYSAWSTMAKVGLIFKLVFTFRQLTSAALHYRQ